MFVKKYQINLHSLICVRAADYVHKFSLLWSLHNFFLHVFYFIFVMDLKTGKENKKKLQKDIILDTLSPISL